MRVDGCIANTSDEIEACDEWCMHQGSMIAKGLGQSEVDKIYPLIESDHEILGLDITMDVISGMKAFQCIELVHKSVKNVLFMNARTRTHHLVSK